MPRMVAFAPVPARRITLRLQSAADASLTAFMVAHVRARDDGQLRLHIDVAAALGAAPASDAEREIIRSEIVGGIMMAKRHAKRGVTIEIAALGGAPSAIEVPSIAYGIAATLAVLQGLDIEDLRIKPRGGYGWSLAAIEVEDC